MRLPRPAHKKGRIEIIPMIDAIFFLLVYFIMTSLSLTQMESHGVQLPESRTAGGKPDNRVVVTVTRTGELYVDRDRLTTDAQVRDVIAARVEQDPEIAVVLNGDRNSDVARFLRVFDLVKQADAKNVLIATTPPVAGGSSTGQEAPAAAVPVDRR